MKIIVGLGNPGKKYKNTRHNAGYTFAGWYFSKLDDATWKKETDFESLIAYGSKNEMRVALVRPQTFMNDSGRATKALCNFYKLEPGKDLLVIHDDTDLPLGIIRATSDSSSAGHKGVQNLIEHLNTQKFHRIRIGVEARNSRDDVPTEDFVLQDFSPEELAILTSQVFPNVARELENFLKK